MQKRLQLLIAMLVLVVSVAMAQVPPLVSVVR